MVTSRHDTTRASLIGALLLTSCGDTGSGAAGTDASASGGAPTSSSTLGSSVGGAGSRGGAGTEGAATTGGTTGRAGSETGGTGQGGNAGAVSDGGSGAAGASGGSAGEAGSGNSGAMTAGAGGAAPDCEPFEMPEDCVPAQDGPLPAELRCTGLYGDWNAREYHCDVTPYKPAHELWSDAAEKHRYVSLPPGDPIDVSDPENFRFPAGTQFWKEFWLSAEDGPVLGETRLMRKTEAGWLYTSYVWSEDGTSAVQNNNGVSDLLSTGHTVPTRDQCRECHEGRGDFILGWDFLMLGEGATGVTLQGLVDQGLLAADAEAALPEPMDWLELEIPGDQLERAALGYLHANCGVSCHNENERASAAITGFFLRLDADTLESPQTTHAVRTGVNVAPGPEAELPPGAFGDYLNFRPLDPNRSLAVARMNVRTEAAMPRLGTNFVDEAGVSTVSAWVDAMTEARGYPAPLE